MNEMNVQGIVGARGEVRIARLSQLHNRTTYSPSLTCIEETLYGRRYTPSGQGERGSS